MFCKPKNSCLFFFEQLTHICHIEVKDLASVTEMPAVPYFAFSDSFSRKTTKHILATILKTINLS
jgi:hypothetical protein